MSNRKLDRETVEKVSVLARLKLTDSEIDAFSAQLSAVLENFESIANVDTTDVPPLVTPTDMSVQLRSDVVTEETNAEELLKNAPEASGRLYKVPPAVS